MSRFHFNEGDTFEHVRTNVIHGISNSIDTIEDDIQGLEEDVRTYDAALININSRIDELEGAELTAENIIALVDNDQGNVDAVLRSGKMVLTATAVGGEAGPAGEGVPTGGTDGQVLVKASDTDYDTEWVTMASGGADLTAETLMTILQGGDGVTVEQQEDHVVVKSNPEGHPVDANQVIYSWDVGTLPAAGKTVSMADVAAQSFFISATSSTSSNTTYMLPELVQSNVVAVETQVKDGRIFYFANTGASTLTITPPASTKIYGGASGSATAGQSVTVAGGASLVLMSCVNPSGGHAHYHTILSGTNEVTRAS